MGSFYFADKRYPELEEDIKKGSVILLPIGTIEEHGKHLPVNTDVVIAEETARRVASRVLPDIPVLVMPALWTGYSAKEMTRWAGTIRVRTRVVIDLIYDVCSSLIQMGFKRIVIVNSHGHHPGLINTACREIADDLGAHVVHTEIASLAKDAVRKHRKSEPGGALHGGEFETSLMLHFGADVDMAAATNEDIMRYHSEFIAGDNFTAGSKVFWSTWGLQESKTGVYGDPTVATAETGEKIMNEIVEQYAAFLEEYWRETNREA